MSALRNQTKVHGHLSHTPERLSVVLDGHTRSVNAVQWSTSHGKWNHSYWFLFHISPLFHIHISEIPASDVEIGSELPCGFQIPSNLTSQWNVLHHFMHLVEWDWTISLHWLLQIFAWVLVYFVYLLVISIKMDTLSKWGDALPKEGSDRYLLSCPLPKQ